MFGIEIVTFKTVSATLSSNVVTRINSNVHIAYNYTRRWLFEISMIHNLGLLQLSLILIFFFFFFFFRFRFQQLSNCVITVDAAVHH